MTHRAPPRSATIEAGVAALVWRRAGPSCSLTRRYSLLDVLGSATELRLQSYLRPLRGARTLRAMRESRARGANQ